MQFHILVAIKRCCVRVVNKVVYMGIIDRIIGRKAKPSLEQGDVKETAASDAIGSSYIVADLFALVCYTRRGS